MNDPSLHVGAAVGFEVVGVPLVGSQVDGAVVAGLRVADGLAVGDLVRGEPDGFVVGDVVREEPVGSETSHTK